MKSMRGWGAGLLAAALVGVVAAGAVYAKPEDKTEPTFEYGGHIHGYLVTAAGQGLTGIVGLRTEEGRLIETYDTSGYRNGRFDIDNLYAGKYRLSVESVGTSAWDLRKPADKLVTVDWQTVSRPKLVCK